jgi:hypothetical protein
MARVDISQADVLQAILLRLQTALALSDRQCYPVARPQDAPSIPMGGDYWLTVSPGAGNFGPEEQADGNVTEDSDVTVTAYTRIKTDSVGHDTDLLLDAARGLLPIKKAILKALVGHDAVDADGNTFLRQLLYAQTATAADIVKLPNTEAAFGRLSITFGLSWDWSLT